MVTYNYYFIQNIKSIQQIVSNIFIRSNLYTTTQVKVRNINDNIIP